MRLILLVICAFFSLACAANNSSSNQPPHIVLPILFPPDGPQLLWHAFQSFVANNNLQRPLESIINGANQNSDDCNSSPANEVTESSTQNSKAKRGHGQKGGKNQHKHAKHRTQHSQNQQ